MLLDIVSAGKTREHGELQDMYRRSLAASWTAQPGDLPADQCIEDIFAGGDGWKDKLEQAKSPKAREHFNHHGHRREDSIGRDIDEDTDLRRHGREHRRTPSGTTLKDTKKGVRHGRGKPEPVQGPGSLVNRQGESSGSELELGGLKHAREVSEYEMREDLVAWRLPQKA